jgi:hypothetical protein
MNWEDLLDDLQEEQAILFLGPELMQLDGKSLGLQVREQLCRENPDDVLHHYLRDGIFLFRDDTAKVSAQKKIKRLYKQLPPDEALLQKIAALPFHLILSLTPDTHLRDTLERCGLTPTFHYFRSTEPFDALPKPEKSKPLIYNLLGVVGDDESLVLDYDDVFNLMKDCLSTGLPPKLAERLVRASTFVFMGFDFEKWHTQMLLRFLSQRPGISKIAIEGDKPANLDTDAFLVNGFKLRFEKGEQAEEGFLDSLYRHCKTQGMLRSLHNEFSDRQVALMRLVHAGRLATALDELLQREMQPEAVAEITLLKARLSGIENEKSRMDSRDYWVEWNKIAFQIIQRAKTIEP